MARGPAGTDVEVDADVGAAVGAGADVVEEPLAAGFDDEHAAIARVQQRSTASLRIDGA
jgi:hypothetical protein